MQLPNQLNFLAFCWQKYGRYLGYVVLMLLVLTVFETCQQYFYVVRYNLAPDEQNLFGALIVGQFYRWLIWLVILVGFILSFAGHPKQTTQNLMPLKTRVIVTITALVAINIVAIALVEIVIGRAEFSLAGLSERLVFYFFQKTPIYTLSYVALLAIYHLLNLQDNLQLEIVGLQSLNEQQQSALEKSKSQHRDDDLAMLSIKVGSSYKMIAVEDICWIEAYDYCVKIHSRDAQVFAMRNSLKALEKQLGSKHFLRIHRKAIVNMQKAREVTFSPNPKVILDNELALEIAQSRVKDVKAYLQ